MTADEAEALDKFGQMVVREVFDQSCEYLQGVISHRMKGLKPDPLHLAYKSLNDESAAVLRRFLWYAVDQTFAQFLNFLDVHQVAVLITTASGKTIDARAASDGLAAEPYSEWGWLAKYSRFSGGIEPKQATDATGGE